LSDLRAATERIEREEFARGHIAPGEIPAVPRPAATIVVTWSPPGGGPYRVLLLRRPDTTRFAAGAHVFAGGVIDPGDGTPESLALLPAALREPEGTAAVAALREMFEETLLLPAGANPSPEAAEDWRQRLLGGATDFATAVRELGVEFEGLRAAYLSRWVTPARFARRYDTRFFLTVVEGPEPPTPVLTPELAGHLWVTPAEGVDRFAAGELPMLFPTRMTLQQLAESPRIETLLEQCADRVPEPIEPRLLVKGDSVRPVLPGDPAYAEAD
jgi:8-oxo-dGTP pyrophosphatase MutT (NUDIX family)